MSEFVMIGNNAATTNTVTTMEVIPEETVTSDSNMNTNTDEANAEVVDENNADVVAGETPVEGEDGQVATDEYIEGGEVVPGIDEGYIDPAFNEGEMAYPGMETGMGEVKDPLLSSWPFVIGISAAVLVVSIALGALLAKLKIKKGIDLYED